MKRALCMATNDPYRTLKWKKAQEALGRPLAQKDSVNWHPTTKDILLALAQLGMVVVTDMFEFKKQMAESLHPGLIDPEYETWRTTQLVKQLSKRRYVNTHEDKNGKMTIAITKQGIRRALTYNLNAMTLNKPKEWDKKWRVVIFDIPVRYGRIRDIFRKRLRQLGLYLLQESVYVSPYPCFDEIEFLRELYDVSFTVRYLFVDRIEEDGELLRHFHLQDTS